jgi:predicted dehydrogenase
MKKTSSRRGFLGRTLAIGGGLGAPAIFPAGFLGAQAPSEKILTGHIGLGGMGTGHLNFFRKYAGALCDVDTSHLNRAARIIGRYVPKYRDFRDLLDQKNLDGVLIATPDHWHGVMAVMACEAGKDVYVQKPSSSTIEEGRAMLNAAQRCGRVMQVGSQGRSTHAAYASASYVRNGMIGKVKEVDCWHYENPVGGGKPNGPPPSNLDWNMWLGPMRYMDYNVERVHFNFRWFLEFGGGQIRDRGAHVMSCALFIMNADGQMPTYVEATGKAPEHGIWDCPTKMEIKYVFKDPDWVMYWRQPGKGHAHAPGKVHGFGSKYIGDKGALVVGGGDGGTHAEKKALEYKIPAGGNFPYKSPGHEQDFINAVRSRKKPIMTIEAGHAVGTLCILGNISYRLGRGLNWDAKNERVIGDEEANRLIARPNRSPWRV